MIFTKKINRILAILGITFMTLIMIINWLSMEYGLKKSVEFTYNAHHKEAQRQISGDIELLKDILKKLAENRKVIEILENNKSFSELDEVEKNVINHEIQSFEGYLKNLIFIDTISITSAPGGYLFSKGELKTKFNLLHRPWIKTEYFDMRGESIVTDVHKDFNTGKYTISIVQFIYSEINEELLGAAILDIYVEDLIEYYDSDFYMGNLKTYIKVNDDEYYYSNGIVNEIQKKSDNYIVELDDVLKNGTKIILEFDKNSIIYTKAMRSINRFRIIVFTVIGTLFLLILIQLFRLTVNPVMKSLDKLKVLLDNVERHNIDFENNNELKQLELISDSLSKSFDKKIQSLIYYDELTKLPNRKMLFRMCNGLIECNVEFALIFIDLNKFKYINDVFGHGAGDEVLVNFSSRMEKCLENKGIVTRYSGDEFIIVYNNYKDNEELEKFYENVILNEFKEPISFNNDNKIIMEFSAGVAVYPKDAQNFDDLIDKSDFMMYSSKRSTESNKLLFFNDDIYNNIIKIENIKEELKTAVDNNEFILYYQPIVDKDKNIKKAEALIRWDNKKLGFVSPIDFIGYAEEIGEIVKIGYWVIEEVCSNFSEFLNNGEIVEVSINVSPIQLMELNFAERVSEIAKKHGVSLSNLCFEITESVVLDENIIIYDNIHLLHGLGANIALDDFGTGYASFSYLKKFKLDILKIDKIFIDNGCEVDFKIVSNVKNIAHLLDMKIVIEGVETEEQFNILSEVGCDYFQGYYFSKPIGLEELKARLRGV